MLNAYAKGVHAFRVALLNPAGAVWRLIEYEDVDGRPFTWIMLD